MSGAAIFLVFVTLLVIAARLFLYEKRHPSGSDAYPGARLRNRLRSRWRR